MRVGQNPLKSSKADYAFAPTILAVVTHLPNTTGAYHSKRMEVIMACLNSMRAGAHTEHTFIVWDNGSIPTLRNWLQYDFRPDVFIQSANVGKYTARLSLARMCPPRSVFAYSDDDMLFEDDWLRPQVELLNFFPNVAAVSGYPVRTSFRWGNENTKAWARQNAQLEYGLFLPREWEDDFARSVGREPEWHKQYTEKDTDARITYEGHQAYATAAHCQHVSYAATIASIINYDGRAMTPEAQFDIDLDSIGLRLSTTQRLVRHMGNVLDAELRNEIMQYA